MLLIHLVLASTNQHKVNEIRRILPESFKLMTLKDIGFTKELKETSGTIPGNALQKARVLWELTGYECIADDSGLEVVALGGRPGVDSAHYAGFPPDPDRNISKLLSEMEGATDRKAAFVTVIALIRDGKEFFFEGRVEGSITYERRGELGFGYDPVFIPEGYDKTFAEMAPEEKNRISHRAKALQKLAAFFEQVSGTA